MWPDRCHCSPGSQPSRDPASQHYYTAGGKATHSKLVWAVLAVRAHPLEASRNLSGAILVRSTLH